METFIPPESRPKPSTPERPNLNALRQIIFHPGEAFATIVAQERRPTWLLPVALILVLTVGAALVAYQGNSSASAAVNGAGSTATGAVATRVASRTGGANPNQNPGGAFPGGGAGGQVPGQVIGGLPGQVGGGAAGQTTTQSGATTAQAPNLWLSLLVPVGGFVLVWLLLGVLTNLFSLAWGGRSNALMALNIAAWSSLPLGARNLMHILYFLSTGAAVTMPGLSGFAPSANGNAGLVFLQNLLSQVDLYLFWQVGLLAVGVGVWGSLSRKKSLPIAILGVLLIVILQSLLGMAFTMLGNINLSTNMLLRLR
jgi:hypothetical protein